MLTLAILTLFILLHLVLKFLSIALAVAILILFHTEELPLSTSEILWALGSILLIRHLLGFNLAISFSKLFKKLLVFFTISWPSSSHWILCIEFLSFLNIDL